MQNYFTLGYILIIFAKRYNLARISPLKMIILSMTSFYIYSIYEHLHGYHFKKELHRSDFGSHKGPALLVPSAGSELSGEV
jgi:hypothetical protein